MTIEQELLQLAEKILKVSEESKRNSESALRTANETFAAVSLLEQQVAQLLADDELNDGIQMSIPNQQGEITMPGSVSLTVGLGSVQPTVVETKAGVPSLDANGNPIYNGPLAFASDNPAAATMDPTAGTVAPIAPGTANCSVTDAIGNLTDTWVVTVTGGVTPPTQNDGIQMTIPAQGASQARRTRF
jgi:hypothetical protein